MRITIISQAPSKSTDGKQVLSGPSGKRLADVMGITHEQLLSRHELINVLKRWPGKDSFGSDKFPMIEARAAVDKLMPKLRGKIVVLLGAKVAKAFGFEEFQYFTKYRLERKDRSTVIDHVFIVPHTSGRCRWYNDENRFLTARKFFAWLLADDERKIV